MKKLLALSFTVVCLTYLFLPARVMAGTFSCIWDTTNNKCALMTGDTCQKANEGEAATICNGYKEYVDCNPGVLMDLTCPNESRDVQATTEQPATSTNLGSANFTCLDGLGVDTAIGCIPTGDFTSFLSFLLRWAFGIAGGIILLMSIATGYALMTSSGDPQKLQGAKENIVAIFSGLILIGFSLVLLQTIGADILKLPTF